MNLGCPVCAVDKDKMIKELRQESEKLRELLSVSRARSNYPTKDWNDRRDALTKRKELGE